jgi:alpha-tubulin suppressor-like RCC1 family protein
MNILLIDKRVQDYEAIVAAIDPALAVGVVFDYFEDTFDTVKARIGALGTNTSGVSVGLIQHKYRTPMFSMLASAEVAPVLSVAAQDPELARWTQFRDFITWCKTEHGAAHFDMMACALYSDPNWKYVIDTLTAQTGVTVRASTDDTGAASLGGDWFLESHTGVNLKTVYFTELIDEYRGVLYSYPYNLREYPTKGFATGSIQAWGGSQYGGTTPANVSSGVVAVYSLLSRFAALKTDGSVVTWSGTNPGITSGVVSIYSNSYAFAALKTDGSVQAWGDSYYGGTNPNISGGVVAVYSTFGAFAALKTDGSIVAWGDSSAGGTNPGISSGVVSIYSNSYAFAALKTDGSVQVWGDSYYGGTNPGISSGVVSIYSTRSAFAALKTDGSVIAWGDSNYGGANPGISSGVVSIYSTHYAFAALKTDGSVQVWGDSNYGGANPGITGGVVAVYSTFGAFAALKTDGSIVAWGDSSAGGTTAPSSVTNANSGVVSIYSTFYAFAALKSDGSIVAWGLSSYGGANPWISSGVVAVYSTAQAFAALKSDGSVQVWGESYYGGANPGISSGVATVYSNDYAFAALKTTATTFDLSFSYYSNMDRYDILRKKENRRRVDLTTLNNNVFTLSAARDIQSFNPTMPTDKVLRIIVPTYVASPHAITSTATIPSGAGSVIIACDEGEPVTISGTTYVNYGSYVYKRETNNTYTKLTTAQTISGASYTMYGGDGVNSSGIALVSAYTFVVASPKVYGDAPFAITTRPTTSSSGAITYTSSDTAVATIDASGDLITIVSPGTATFIATQAADGSYASSTMTSNVLTVNKIAPTLALVGVAATVSKNSSDAPFTVAASSASSGAVTYTSSNAAVATVGSTTGLVTLVASGSVTITAAQASTAFYSAPTSVTCVVTVGAVESLAGQTVTTSLANRNFTGASFANAVLTNVSLAGATLTNVNFSGATVAGANFANANIVGATNLPAFSTTQKLQLLRNANNVAISAVQITTLLSGTEVNAAITTPVPDIVGATFVVKAPALDASGIKIVTVTSTDVSNNASLYIPMNSGETVKVNGVTYTFNGSAVLVTGTVVTFITVLGKPFRLYAGSIIGLNVIDKLNNVKIAGHGLYDVLVDLYALKT